VVELVGLSGLYVRKLLDMELLQLMVEMGEELPVKQVEAGLVVESPSSVTMLTSLTSPCELMEVIIKNPLQFL
jgi:hypothetical protein